MTVPLDPALPQLRLLLDPQAMAPLLGCSLGRSARLGRVQAARVSYKPGERVSVHYAAEVDGRAEDAVARAIVGRDLEARLREPRVRELARRVNGRSPAAVPLVYEPEAQALVSWLPFDPRLPALALPSGREARLLSYRPGRRAVLRVGDQVLKAYGSADRYSAAARALRAGSTLPIATPARGAFQPHLRLTTQAAVDGEPVSAPAAAGEVGALLRRLRRASPGALVEAPLDRRPLAVAVRKAALIAAVVPELAGRVDTLVRRLARTEPPASRPVPAHGDFHAGQLLRAEGELVVVDLDALCLADPALDLAEYAATEPTVLDALLEGYGGRPDALDWHLAAALLIRASHPFNLQLPGWPEHVEAGVASAETVLEGVPR